MRIASYIIMGILVLIFITKLNTLDVGNEFLNYQFRSLQHANLAHIAANLFSFYNLSFIEDIMGTKSFLLAMIFIWIVSSSLLYAYHRVFPSRKRHTVGFSAVIFGLIIIYYTLLNQSPGISLIGLALSILPQILVPGISWEGHICGIIAGIIYVMLFPLKQRISK